MDNSHSDARNVWDAYRDLEARVRAIEASIAVLLAANQAAQTRNNYLPGWVIGIIGITISAISVAASLWATG